MRHFFIETLIGGITKKIFRRSDASLRESLSDVLDEAENEDEDFSPEEQHMLRNLLGFRDITVEKIMVPRADIHAVDENISLAALLAAFLHCAHSRMPVFRDTLDFPLGMVHIKDLLGFMQNKNGTKFALSHVQREVLFVAPSMPALDLLLKMQATRIHMALVVDEYGGTDGLVTIEDLIEEIVGDIDDEHDDDFIPALHLIDTGKWESSARLPVSDLYEALSISLPQAEFDDIDTLGGLVFAMAGRVPQRGEVITYDLADGRQIEFIIRDANPRLIKFVGLRLRDKARA